jgi:hypothetical protein
MYVCYIIHMNNLNIETRPLYILKIASVIHVLMTSHEKSLTDTRMECARALSECFVGYLVSTRLDATPKATKFRVCCLLLGTT